MGTKKRKMLGLNSSLPAWGAGGDTEVDFQEGNPFGKRELEWKIMC